MTSSFPYIATDRSLTLVIGTKPYAIPNTHPNFDQIQSALADPLTTTADLEDLIDIPLSVQRFTNSAVTAKDGVLYLNEEPLDGNLATRILQFVEAGNPELAEPLVNFLVKLQDNPSYRAKQGLYEWAARSGLPITPDGYVLAWKAVKKNGYDHYSQTILHEVGVPISMPRNKVDEDPDRTCSSGLHICAASYLPNYTHSPDCRVLLMKIHPKDFVAVPRDYNCAKARVCAYTPIAECPPEEVAEYLGDSLVYNPDPDFEVGQAWEDTDGDRCIIYDIDEEGGIFVTYEEGQYEAGSSSLVTLLDEAHSEPLRGVQVNDRVVMSNGDTLTVDEIDRNDETVKLSNGGWYNLDGTNYGDVDGTMLRVVGVL